MKNFNPYKGIFIPCKIFEPPHEKTQQSAYAKTKAQISFAVTVSFAVPAKRIRPFVFTTRIVQFQNFQSLSIFCACTARFMSDLFENHIVGFPTRLISDIFSLCKEQKCQIQKCKYLTCQNVCTFRTILLNSHLIFVNLNILMGTKPFTL